MSKPIQGLPLEINILGCINLKDTEWLSRQDPYVVIEYAHTKFRTKTCKDGGKNPTFNEKFVLTLIEGMREVVIQVWNSNTVSADDFIGSGRVLIQNAITNGFDNSTWPITNATGKHTGDVTVILHFGSKGSEKLSGHSSSTYHAPPGSMPYPQPMPQVGTPYCPPPTAHGAYPPSGYPAPPSSHGPPPSGSYPPSGYPAPLGSHGPLPSGYPPTSGSHGPPPSGYPAPLGSHGPPSSGYPPTNYPPAGYPPQGPYSVVPPGGVPYAQPAYPPKLGHDPYHPGNYPVHGGPSSHSGHHGGKHEKDKHGGKHKKDKDKKHKKGKHGGWK